MRLLYVYIVLMCACICGIVYLFLPHVELGTWVSLMQMGNISVISEHTKSQTGVTDYKEVDESKYFGADRVGQDAMVRSESNVPKNAWPNASRGLTQDLNSSAIRTSGIATNINQTYGTKEGVTIDRFHVNEESFRMGFDNNKTCQMLKDDITIVTSFIYLGERFPKGTGYRGSNIYFDWIKIFRQIKNPVVAYFSREEDRALFRQLRPMLSKLKTTTEILVTKDMWAFQLQGKLRKELNSSDEYQNLLRKYNCIQHAKYELLLRAANENPYCTRYIQWLDIGLFRSLVEKNVTEQFSMWLPENYNDSCVAYSGVRRRSPTRSPGDIITNGGCWLVGATALANITLMKVWAKGYMEYTEKTIDKYNVIVSDQGILYSWMNANQNVLPVQEYRSRVDDEVWFALGYRCREAGLMRDTGKRI